MRNHRRVHSTKPFLVVGGLHDGKVINVLASPNRPIENVIRLPVPKSTITDFMPAPPMQPREQDEVVEYYAHQLRMAHYRSYEGPNREVESYWFYCVDKELKGWTDYTVWDQAEIDNTILRLRKFYKALA